jgi:hydrogenase-4 membrane subunit HyfE
VLLIARAVVVPALLVYALALERPPKLERQAVVSLQGGPLTFLGVASTSWTKTSSNCCCIRRESNLFFDLSSRF